MAVNIRGLEDGTQRIWPAGSEFEFEILDIEQHCAAHQKERAGRNT